MKKNLKTFYIKTLVFFIITFVILKIFDNHIIHDEVFTFVVDELEKKENKNDFFFFGNSLSRRSYHKKQFDSILKTNSLNLGSEAQHFSITHAVFSDLINNNAIDPGKTVIITISPWQFKILKDQDWWMFLQMAALDKVNDINKRVSLTKQFYGLDGFPKAFSTSLRFHDELSKNILDTYSKSKLYKKTPPNGFVNTISKKLSNEMIKKRPDIENKANAYLHKIFNDDFTPLTDNYNQMILDIIDQCKEKNINLLFITPPSINNIYSDSDIKTLKYFHHLFKEKKINYLDFNLFFKYLDLKHEHFSDYAHLNVSGSKMITSEVCAYIRNSQLPTEILLQIDNIEKQKIYFETLTTLQNLENLHTNPIIYTYNSKKQELLSRNQKNAIIIKRSNTENTSFAYTNPIDTETEKTYLASVTVKKSNNSNYFGLRIQGSYPNRVDAIYNIEGGKVKSVASEGLFLNEQASIIRLGNGWFKCFLSAKINGDNVKLIFGSTDNNQNTLSWEAKTEKTEEVMIIPDSTKLSLIEKR